MWSSVTQAMTLRSQSLGFVSLAATLSTEQRLVLQTSPTNSRDNTIRQKSFSWELPTGCLRATASASFWFRETTTFLTIMFLLHLSGFQSPALILSGPILS